MSDPPLCDSNGPVTSELLVANNGLLGRSDSLVYTSEILNNSLTVIGGVVVNLAFSSTTQDTDMAIELMNIWSDEPSVKFILGFSNQLSRLL